MPPPDLSRFELQCLGKLWSLGNASIRAVHQALDDAPSYSTVKTIIERLEEKGAVVRVRREGRAWIYRSTVRPHSMMRKEVRRLVDTLFDGRASRLVAHLADTNELSLSDLREIEQALEAADEDVEGRSR